MQIVKNLQNGNTTFSMPNQTVMQNMILRVIQFTNHALLLSIFTNNLDRRRFDLLEADTVHINYAVNSNEDFGWIYVFAKSGNPGIHYDENFIGSVDLIKHMITFENLGSNVLFAIEVAQGASTDFIKSDIEKKVDVYISSRK